MTNDDLLLLQTSVFTGITTDEIRDMLSCLSARETTFTKDEIIFSYGENITGIGIVLEGSVHIVKEDFWGNANLMAECAPGDIFGEAYAINSTEPLEMNIFAASTCRILFLEVSKILTVCPSACAFHNRLIRNLLTLVSRKNFQLNRKLEHMSKPPERNCSPTCPWSQKKPMLQPLPFHSTASSLPTISLSTALPCPMNCAN